MTNLKIDLENDFKNILIEVLSTIYLKKYNINVSQNHWQDIKNKKPDELLSIFFNLQDRLLLCRKSTVFISKELYINPLFKIYKKEIMKLKKIFENGSSVRPFLSDRINNLIYSKSRDGLLLDWGLHHIHFFTEKQRKKINDNNILFLMKQNDSIYFIDIFSHGDFFNFKSLEIIHKNWANILTQYRLVGIKPNILTEEDFKQLRKNNVSYTIGFKDEPNIAYCFDINHFRQKDVVNILNKLDQLQEHIKEIYKKLFINANAQIIDFEIKLILQNGEIKLDESNSSIQSNCEQNIKELNEILKNYKIIL